MYPSQSQMANGLMRYRSAPSSFFEALVGGNGGAGEEFPGTVTPENLVGRYFTGDSSCLTTESTARAVMPPPVDLEEPRQLLRPPLAPSPAQVEKKSGYGGDGYCESEIVYGASSSGGGVGFPAISHLGVGIGGGGGGFKSNLTRHSSSPAGFLANLNMENGYSLAAGLGNYSSENCSNGGVGGPRRLKSQLSFSTQDSAPSLISQLSDISNMADVGENNGNSSSDDGIPVGSWDDTHPISFGNPHRKRSRDMMNGDHVIHGLSDSQYGLAKNSLDMATMEKLLHLHQDSVPCKIRAKRGCATHPRSIAERERRTRISEKLRKLQELVPNMDKQTNTADMLDLAVQYIKTLQTDLQKLSQDRANCTCSCKQESNS